MVAEEGDTAIDLPDGNMAAAIDSAAVAKVSSSMPGLGSLAPPGKETRGWTAPPDTEAAASISNARGTVSNRRGGKALPGEETLVVETPRRGETVSP
jgi:hypothetical protein